MQPRRLLDVIIGGELIALNDLLQFLGIAGISGIASLLERLRERRQVTGLLEGFLVPPHVMQELSVGVRRVLAVGSSVPSVVGRCQTVVNRQHSSHP
jgi:hypothetical protein